MAAAFGLRYLQIPPIIFRTQFSNNYKYLPSTTQKNSLLSLKPKSPNSNLHLFITQVQTQPTVQSEIAQNGVVDEIDNVSNTRLLVQNVPWMWGPDDIRPLFEEYGAVKDIELVMHNKTKNRGLAFVTMGSNEEARVALSNLESKEFAGRILKLNWATPKKKKLVPVEQPKPMPVHNLHVSNLPFQARANDLMELFKSENVNIVSAEVIFIDTPKRRSAGYGFISFNTKAEAEAAIATFQDKELMGRPIRLALSKKFLRQAAKAVIESENATNESSSTEQSDAALVQ